MQVYFYTFGCKANQYETESAKRIFEGAGYAITENSRCADVIVINSCTVTAQSDSKTRKLIHRLRRENPPAVIILCGCFPQAFSEQAELIPEADIIAGASNKSALPELVMRFIETGNRVVDIPKEAVSEKSAAPLFNSKTRGIIRVQDGCDRFCSYCIIPYARGRSRSKPLEDIAAEAESLVKSGHREIVVVGINLSDYGRNSGSDLADAVVAVSKSGAERVRLGSLEADELSGEIIKKLADIPALCPHFHLSLQSGCDKTLKEMRRKYDKEKYFTLVNHLRELFPGCAITTDIMVGFPGETDEDFEESLNFVKEIGFTDAHVFPYSRREETLAAKRADQVPQRIKEQRAKIMSEAVKMSRESYLESMIGGIQTVLFEREKTPDFHQGHTANYCTVKVKSFTDTLFRQMLPVRITGRDGDELSGEIIRDNTYKADI